MLLKVCRWRFMLRSMTVLIVVIILFGTIYLTHLSERQIEMHEPSSDDDYKIKEFHHGNLVIINIINKTRDKEVINRLNIQLDNDVWIPDDGYNITGWPQDTDVAGNNITGWPRDIVPNIVHYVLFGQRKISYVHMLSIFSVVRIQKPEVIFIHCDCHKMDDDDENWHRILNFVNATNRYVIHINEVMIPTEIYGKKIGPYPNFHGGDITRFRTLRKFGGIYLDNDVFVCQSLNGFRKFEFTLGWEVGEFLGNQVMIGNRNARFLKFTLDSYREYYPDEWYYNAGELPTIAILNKYPQLIHRVKRKFGYDASVTCPYFYKEYHSDWQSEFYAFHMIARGNEISWKGSHVSGKKIIL
ncbi:uncharacterized protein LOC119076702 [Bradysia coprophila]|uniref:uncharacterized protein LOC119076702 n=1 Tax=Bradysia coprophila TaxID=38358 RepID=UPI00187D84B9|nr:uncharacterized protein LOC119076702 [Bradysia coprophila]